MNTICNDVLNMKETVNRARQMGIRITEYTLRQAIKSGQLPCRIVGRTYLLSWNVFYTWITCGD